MIADQRPRARGGNRQALLEGALVCLQERGFARTTARDIVAASGTNLGAIGYHYASTERLLNQALLVGFERWFAQMAETAAEHAGDARPLVGISRALADTFEENRPLACAFIEALAQAEHSSDIRDGLLHAYSRGRELIGQLLPDGTSGAERTATASLVLAMFDGLLIQWMLDPAQTHTAEQLAKLADTLARPRT